MTADIEKLKRWTEEDAYSFCVEYLQAVLAGKIRAQNFGGFDIYASQVLDSFCEHEKLTDHNDRLAAGAFVSRTLLSGLWQLCLRGILRPSVSNLNIQHCQERLPGASYSITEEGKRWLTNSDNLHMLLASRSFAELLCSNSDRFGIAYKERVVEAVKCFDTGCYLACCSMCGAACESIYLALAVSKKGDEAEVLKRYRSSDGRKQLQNIIEQNLPGGLIRSLKSGFEVVAYWRDCSAHGEVTNLGRSEARACLNILLTLVQTANDRWDDITINSAAAQLVHNATATISTVST